jgi:hypothetical protein
VREGAPGLRCRRLRVHRRGAWPPRQVLGETLGAVQDPRRRPRALLCTGNQTRSKLSSALWNTIPKHMKLHRPNRARAGLGQASQPGHTGSAKQTGPWLSMGYMSSDKLTCHTLDLELPVVPLKKFCGM